MQIQGQIYNQLEALLPLPDADYQFLQIYVMGNQDAKVEKCCAYNSRLKRNIVQELQTFLHQNNDLVKMSLDRMPLKRHNIVIGANIVPASEHARRFNSPTIDDVTIV